MPSVIEIKSLSTNIHTYNNIEHLLKKQTKQQQKTKKRKANKPKRNLYITYIPKCIHTYILTYIQY